MTRFSVSSSCFVLIALLLNLSASAHSAEDETKIDFQPLQPGTSVHETSRMELAFSIQGEKGDAKKTVLEQKQSGLKKRTLTLLERAPDGVEKLQAVYETYTQQLERTGIEPQTRHDPVEGKTYSVLRAASEATNAKLEITDEKKAEPPAAEIKTVTRDLRQAYASAARFASLLKDVALTPGQKIDVPDEVKDELAGGTGPGGMQAEAYNLTFKEMRENKKENRQEAVFTLEMKLAKAEPAFKMSVEMKGELVYRRLDGAPLSITLNGPVTISGAQGDGETRTQLSGGGTLKVEVVTEYSAAK